MTRSGSGSQTDDTDAALGWLGRKIAWGFKPGELDEWRELGLDAVLARLIDPDDSGIAPGPDPFARLDPDPLHGNDEVVEGIGSWIDLAVEGERQLEMFMWFFWSDYFGVGVRGVAPRSLMWGYMTLLGRHALGNFGELLRSVTIDRAMLRFLDGGTNTRRHPNENYGRELLELYSVGVGNHTEDDVLAASTALTGWAFNLPNPEPSLYSYWHDDTPQTLLGTRGVHDLDTVIEAVLAAPATADRLVRLLAEAILGPGHDPTPLAAIAARFRRDYEIRPVVKRLLELGVRGAAQPSLLEPFPWYVLARKATGARVHVNQATDFFFATGQTPWNPPNVGGYPAPDTYLSTGATIARFNMAAKLIEAAALRQRIPDHDGGEGLAELVGLTNGFTRATRDAIASLDEPGDRLAAALAAPECIVVQLGGPEDG